jgi:putative endonuclease
MSGYVYSLASGVGGTLYVGVTSDLIARIHQHKTGSVEGFTSKYKVDRLVYFELHSEIAAAIQREKQIKRWYRKWKIELIEKHNPQWIDLYLQIATPRLLDPRFRGDDDGASGDGGSNKVGCDR